MVLLPLSCHLLFPYSSSCPSALNTNGDHLYSRTGTNYAVSSSSISFKVKPWPPWTTLPMQCLMMRSDTFPFLGSSIGCLQSSLIWECCNLLTTRITSDFLCFTLVFKFFTNSTISATILTIFDQVAARFSRTDKMSVCTTIWFTCTSFFSSGSSVLVSRALVLVFHLSSGS